MSLYDQQLPPVRQFSDLDAPVVAEKGRVSIRENYASDEMQIVVRCRSAGNSEGEADGFTYADVGWFGEKAVAPDGKKGPAKTQYQVCLRQYEKIHTVPFDRDKALDFALDLTLAAFGESNNYLVDLEHQPAPTMSQLRDVLIKYELVDPKTLPKPKPKRQQTHGHRGRNTMSPAEAEALGVPVLG